MARILDQREVVAARGLGELAELLGEPRDIEPRVRTLRRALRLVRAHGGELGERVEIRRENEVARDHAERRGVSRIAAR